MNGQIREAVRQLAGTQLKDEVTMVMCTVVAADEATRTCTCTTINGNAPITFTDVRLMAEVDDGMLLIPTAGSSVIVSYSKRNPPYISMYSQVDKVLFITGDSFITMIDASVVIKRNETTLTIQEDSIVAVKGNSSLTINGDGHSIKKSGDSLRDILSNLMDAIKAITVPTNAGPSSTPINFTTFDTLKQKIENLLA